MKFPKINILLSADYELFLGRNFGDANEVLFEPTRKLLEVCNNLSVPMTLFADVCSVWAHRDFGLNEYADAFEEQLLKADQNNHAVELHLHPHWLYSTYSSDQWKIDTSRMYMSELGYGDDTGNAAALIKRGMAYLTDLMKYKPVAFRAAGLAMQPDDKKLIDALLNNGLTIDSSIAKGLKFSSDTVVVDYTKTPGKANWYMSAESGIELAAETGLYEIPIATFRANLITRIGFLIRRLQSVRMRRGAGISRAASQTKLANLKTMISYNSRYLLTNPWFSLSCDTKGFNLKMLTDGLDRFIQKHQGEQEIFISMINHPKLMFDKQFGLFNDFVVSSKRKYGEQLSFMTYQQVAERLAQKDIPK